MNSYRSNTDVKLNTTELVEQSSSESHIETPRATERFTKVNRLTANRPTEIAKPQSMTLIGK